MKNKKGFTLIELLGVILIIAILLWIAVPTVMKYMKKGTKAYYESIESEMKTAGADYMETYRSLLPQQIDHVAVISLDELEDNKYIDKVVDEKGNECTGKVTIEKINTDSYKYHSCLICGEYYSSEEQECNYSESNNQYEDSGDYEIRVPQDRYEVHQGDNFVVPLASVYYKGELIKSDLEGEPSKINTNKLGTYEIIYFYHGAKKKIYVDVKDGVAPGKVQIVLKYRNKNGKSYKGEWFSGNIYVSYKATDYSGKGIMGSGIDHYEVSDDGNNFHRLEADNQGQYKKLSETEQELIKEGNYVRYVRAIDKKGNVGPVNSYRVKIDKTVPTCTFAGESTDWISVGERTIVATCHDSISECTSGTKNKTWKVGETTKTKYLEYAITDLAGNTTTCKKTTNIYIDKVKPTIKANASIVGIDFQQHLEIKSFFTTTQSISPVSIQCKVDDTRTTNPVNGTIVTDTYTLRDNFVKVRCTITSASHLSASALTEFRHQYDVAPTGITDSYWCGTYQCNCHEVEHCCCHEPCGGQGSTNPDGSTFDHSGEATCYHCEYDTVCSSCANSCIVYDCVDEARHADGQARSTTDKTCYY